MSANAQDDSRRPPPGFGAERLIRPAILASMPRPWPAEVDCDELAMHVASMLLALGVPCQFVTVSTDPQDPMRFNHVYVQAIREDGTKVPLDLYGPELGWEPQWIRRKEWPIMLPDSKPQATSESNEVRRL
jgi:hypothetical protein